MSTENVLTAKPQFEILDGLRGVAAMEIKSFQFILGVCALAAWTGHADLVAGREVYRAVSRAEDAVTVPLESAKGYPLSRMPSCCVRTADEIVLANGPCMTNANGLVWTLPLPKGSSTPFTVAAESLFEAGAEDGGNGGNYSLYLDVHYQDGSALYGQKHPFIARKGLGWQRGIVSVVPDKPIQSVSCYLLFRYHDGRVRFHPPVLKTFKNAGFAVFDSTAVQVADASEEPMLLLHDAANAGDGWTSLADGASVKGLRAAVRRTEAAGATFFDVRLDSLSDADRAMTLAYSIPLPAGELVWLDDPRTEVPMGTGSYRNVAAIGCGVGVLSTWPFGAVRAGGETVALGFDPEAPAIFRVTGSGRLRRLLIAFDLGFAKEKRDAHVRFVAFKSPGAEGFRGALAAYARLFPEAFKVRIRKHGIWMAFRPISKVERFEDFGFGIKEGDGEPAWDDAHGILTTHYTEPTSWWMTMRTTNAVSFADALACAEAEAAREPRRNAYARAWKVSTYRDEFGSVTGNLCDRPWCKGACWNMCSLPGIAGGEYEAKLSEADFAKRYGSTVFPAGVDGEYIDSAECHLPPRVDFCRAHFAASRTPLCWSMGSHRPCVSTALAIYEYVRGAAERVHARGRIMQANGVPMRWPWLFPFVDYGGQETKWIERGEGAWQPMSDRDLLYRMALSFGKPYCFLMNVKFENLTDEMVEKYFQRCLAYGLMSSFFSPNASGGHYFTRPELYNRHRPFFLKYGPLQRAVSEAGWRPLNTLATVASGSAFAEQFGDRYVTVFNSGRQPVTVRLRSTAGKTHARERVTGADWTFTNGELTIELPPETCRLLDFE